jgi:hypothetical protein
LAVTVKTLAQVVAAQNGGQESVVICDVEKCLCTGEAEFTADFNNSNYAAIERVGRAPNPARPLNF